MQVGAQDRLVQIAFAATHRGSHKISGHTPEPIGTVRPFRQGRWARPAALVRVRFQDHSVANDADFARFTIDLDRVRAFLGGRGQTDVAHTGTWSPSRTLARVLERMLVEAARFEPRSNVNRNAGRAQNAIERVPAVIEQDAAASHRRIDAPIR